MRPRCVVVLFLFIPFLTGGWLVAARQTPTAVPRALVGTWRLVVARTRRRQSAARDGSQPHRNPDPGRERQRHRDRDPRRARRFDRYRRTVHDLPGVLGQLLVRRGTADHHLPNQRRSRPATNGPANRAVLRTERRAARADAGRVRHRAGEPNDVAARAGARSAARLSARRHRILAMAGRRSRRQRRQDDAARLARRERHRLYADRPDGGAVPAAARQEAVQRRQADDGGGSSGDPGRADLFRPVHRAAEERIRDALPDRDPEPRRDRQLAAAELRGQGRRADSQVSADDAERPAGAERDPSETAGRPHRHVA